MDAQIINPFIKATIEVIKTMAHVTVKAGKPYLKKDHFATGDVTSIIGLTGNPNGSISISFDAPSVLHIVSSMFGEPMEELNAEVADATGELFNMISGMARRELEDIGRVFHGAIPTVFRGKGHKITHITEGPQIAVPFTTELGGFVIEVCFEHA